VAQIEREIKLIVSSEDYDLIRRKGRVLECREQLNVYLHDPSRLHQGLGYFRVRYETGKEPVATLKIPLGWEGPVRTMVEIEQPLRELGPALFPRPRRRIQVRDDIPGEFGEHFLTLGITRLLRLGWMRNLRCLVDVGEGVVELDRTRLPNGSVEFEVEIETPDEVLQATLAATIREWAPSATQSQVGKFSRFLACLESPSTPW